MRNVSDAPKNADGDRRERGDRHRHPRRPRRPRGRRPPDHRRRRFRTGPVDPGPYAAARPGPRVRLPRDRRGARRTPPRPQGPGQRHRTHGDPVADRLRPDVRPAHRRRPVTAARRVPRPARRLRPAALQLVSHRVRVPRARVPVDPDDRRDVPSRPAGRTRTADRRTAGLHRRHRRRGRQLPVQRDPLVHRPAGRQHRHPRLRQPRPRREREQRAVRHPSTTGTRRPGRAPPTTTSWPASPW